MEEFRVAESKTRERTLREPQGAPGEYRRGLFARGPKRSDDFSRQRQDELPGDPDGEGFNPRDQQSPDRPGPGEVRDRLCVAAVRLEKHRHGKSAVPFGRESAGDISIRESGFAKTFRGPGCAAAWHGLAQREARRERNAGPDRGPARSPDARSAQRRVSQARAGDVRYGGRAAKQPARFQRPFAADENPAGADHGQYSLRHSEDDRGKAVQ